MENPGQIYLLGLKVIPSSHLSSSQFENGLKQAEWSIYDSKILSRFESVFKLPLPTGPAQSTFTITVPSMRKKTAEICLISISPDSLTIELHDLKNNVHVCNLADM